MYKNDYDVLEKALTEKEIEYKTTHDQLKKIGIDGEYEKHQIRYTKPATNHTYKPDFRLPNGIFIETKGRFTLED